MKLKVIGIVVGLMLLVVGIPYGYLTWYKDFAPRMQNAQHGVFKQTQSYIDGKITHLNRLKLDYEIAEEGHKAVLRAAILSEASTVDRDKLPFDLQSFLDTL